MTNTFFAGINMLHRVLCAFSTVVILAAQQPAPTSGPAELLLGKARALEARGRIDLAVQAWQQLLLIDPDQQDAIAGLARAAKMTGKDAQAEIYLEKLRRLNAKNPAIAQIESTGKTARRNPELEEAARLAAAGQPAKAVASYQRAFGGNTPPLSGRRRIMKRSPQLLAAGRRQRQPLNRRCRRIRRRPTADSH